MKQISENLTLGSHNWETSPEEGSMPYQLKDFIAKIIDPMGLKLDDKPIRDAENLEYGGVALSIGGKNILFRVAKTTPTKAGQFVALYKRSVTSGKIIPIDVSDNYDYVFIASFNKHYHGVFVFSKDILIKKGVYPKEKKGGKLSFRIYAPWVNTIAPQAKQTQNWQCKYFLSLDVGKNGEQPDFIQMSLDFNPDRNIILKQFEKLFL